MKLELMTKTAWISCVLLLGHPQMQFAQTSATTHVSGEREQRHASYLQLNRQIFARHEDRDSEKVHVSESGKVTEIRSQLHQLISDEIDSVLNSSAPSKNSIKAALANLQGEMALPVDDMTNTPFAQRFQLAGIQSVAVGYVILQGGEAIPDTQAYLEFYDNSNGRWERRAEPPTRTDFRGCTFFVSKIDSGVPGESWFVVWGMTIGDTGARLRLRLYEFDGATVRTVWKRDGLIGGIATVSKDSVTLEYDREYRSTDPNNRAHETLHVSPNGLE